MLTEAADFQSSTVRGLIAGWALVATVIRRNEDMGADWVDRVVELMAQGTAA